MSINEYTAIVPGPLVYRALRKPSFLECPVIHCLFSPYLLIMAHSDDDMRSLGSINSRAMWDSWQVDPPLQTPASGSRHVSQAACTNRINYTAPPRRQNREAQAEKTTGNVLLEIYFAKERQFP